MAGADIAAAFKDTKKEQKQLEKLLLKRKGKKLSTRKVYNSSTEDSTDDESLQINHRIVAPLDFKMGLC